MNKETLEEEAHKMLVDYGIKSMGQSIGVLDVKKLMVKIAKHQQERSYSDEDLREAIHESRMQISETEGYIFEQLKKK